MAPNLSRLDRFYRGARRVRTVARSRSGHSKTLCCGVPSYAPQCRPFSSVSSLTTRVTHWLQYLCYTFRS